MSIFPHPESADKEPSASQKRAQVIGLSPTPIWPVDLIHNLTDAILHTLIYADLFDYPLRVEEIHRYLTGHAASLVTVQKHLERDGRLGEQVASTSPYWYLSGREHLIDLRHEREAFSQILWSRARQYGRLMAAIPFVRMVSITGSLTMNNVSSPQDDVDFLIVTASNRVWLARGLVILIVHLARRFRVEICPNYVMAEHRLKLDDLNLFTAHELAQLVPLYGLSTYRRLLENNAWMTVFLPNASPRQDDARDVGAAVQFGQRVLEVTLRGRLGDAAERRERERKIPRLRRIADERGGKGALYAPDLCKGHANDHATSVYERYTARLAAQGL